MGFLCLLTSQKIFSPNEEYCRKDIHTVKQIFRLRGRLLSSEPFPLPNSLKNLGMVQVTIVSE
jgi:hypothetical protein